MTQAQPDLRPAPGRIRAAYWRGFRQGLPFLLVIVPFGLLFGVAGTEAGLNLAEVMGFSILVIAGASQFTAVQLMVDQAPTVMVILTALAVNLRMAMYSASLAPHLGRASTWHKSLVAYFMVDQVYAMSVQDYETRPEQSLAEKLAYYAGVCSPVCPQWYVSTLVGALVGQAIPPEFALDFAVPITFLAMIGPALRTLPHVIAACVSVVVALVFAFLPAGTGLLIAAAAAMIAGGQAELWLERARARRERGEH
jgi:4-azaleucine resistance transporter AzlC